jgi:hypothetical protein
LSGWHEHVQGDFVSLGLSAAVFFSSMSFTLFLILLNFYIRELEFETKDKEVLQVNVAFNYGGRMEILDTTKKLCKQVKQGIINILF